MNLVPRPVSPCSNAMTAWSHLIISSVIDISCSFLLIEKEPKDQGCESFTKKLNRLRTQNQTSPPASAQAAVLLNISTVFNFYSRSWFKAVSDSAPPLQWNTHRQIAGTAKPSKSRVALRESWIDFDMIFCFVFLSRKNEEPPRLEGLRKKSLPS